MGNLLRERSNINDDLGKSLKQDMAKGKLVDPSLSSSILKEKLHTLKSTKGFILDGYPRALDQLKYFESMTYELGLEKPIVIHIDIDLNEALSRLKNRFECTATNTTYSGKHKSAQIECKKAGGVLTKRVDDNEITLRNRFKVYKEQTIPVLNYYKAQRIVIKINGKQDTNNVFNDIKEVLNDYY